MVPGVGVLGGSPGHCFHLTVQLQVPPWGPELEQRSWKVLCAQLALPQGLPLPSQKGQREDRAVPFEQKAQAMSRPYANTVAAVSDWAVSPNFSLPRPGGEGPVHGSPLKVGQLDSPEALRLSQRLGWSREPWTMALTVLQPLPRTPLGSSAPRGPPTCSLAEGWTILPLVLMDSG